MNTEKLTLVIASVLLAALSMMLVTCYNISNIPYKRQKLCLDHGFTYEWDRSTNGVSCKEIEK